MVLSVAQADLKKAFNSRSIVDGGIISYVLLWISLISKCIGDNLWVEYWRNIDKQLGNEIAA